MQILRSQLQQYATTYLEEVGFLPRFMELTNFPDCCLRSFLPGHFTGSAWIIDETAQHVVLVHHKKLNRWLQPGGHADGDQNLARVALREATEETGLEVRLMMDAPWDIDIHTIPARGEMPEHDHFDVRYLMVANNRKEPVVSDESTAVRWIPVPELHLFTDSRSVLRMAEKTDKIKRSGSWPLPERA